jgi:hypothetical protein
MTKEDAEKLQALISGTVTQLGNSIAGSLVVVVAVVEALARKGVLAREDVRSVLQEILGDMSEADRQSAVALPVRSVLDTLETGKPSAALGHIRLARNPAALRDIEQEEKAA